MDFIGRFLVMAMDWLQINVFHDYGLTVVSFTILIKLLTLPADIKQRQSTANLSVHSAEIQKIQKRYASDPQTAQKKVSEYYKKVGVSPYASCLPMAITLVFFMVFLSAMRLWANIETTRLYLNPTVEQLSQFKWGWVYNIWQPDSGFKTVIMDYKEFARIPFEKLSFAFDAATIDSLKVYGAAEKAKDAAQIAANQAAYAAQMKPLTDAYSEWMNGWFALPALCAVTSLLTGWLTQKLQPPPSSAGNAQAESMGKMMIWMMPIMSVMVCLSSNAAFALYWLTSNILTAIVTVVLNAKKLKNLFPHKEKSKEA